ncbi:hypothetical protein M3148_16715 [Georgenia satyanarayanai]|uniref:hypothetical protein n=1 Tax=Georgenia satyanarayanai TaxID=860221 RepID=UPI00203ED817|nr:hypothetical protein [Georgenia satyanarayanai]MCM3662617.1 hypothetical protein [Georgenia satyanarayanai]
MEPESVEQRRIDGFDYTIRRYPDGSFHASGLEVPTAVPSSGITPFASITGCSFTRVGGSARYSNCTVREVLAPISGDFRADYRMDAGQNTAQITYAGAPGVIIAGGSASNVRVVMVRSSYAPGIPARAELRFTGSAQGWAGVALWVQLQVIPTGAVALSNFDIV